MPAHARHPRLTRRADLIAIGYDEEATAATAAVEVTRLSHTLLIDPDQVAVVARARDGTYAVTTNESREVFWEPLFGALFPVAESAEGMEVGQAFQEQVRDLVQPGTSALFVMVDKVTPDRVIKGLSRFGGTVVRTTDI